MEALKDLFTPDCVHLTSLGHTRLAKCIIESANTAAKRLLDTADCSVAGVKLSFYWRGFCSVREGTRTAHSATSYKVRAGQSGSRGGAAAPVSIRIGGGGGGEGAIGSKMGKCWGKKINRD